MTSPTLPATEARNPASEALDTLDALSLVTLINQQDLQVAPAVAAVLPAVANAVDAIAERLARGGRLIYIGAGTSGRLGVLDASECPPTFSAPPDLVIGIIAGGERALRHPIEGAEDNAEQGRADLTARDLSADDFVVGLAASGRTPYVIGALAYAREIGAATAAVTCDPASPMKDNVDVFIGVDVGPEVITGSTRMKAGTAQKLILNMLSSGAMVRLGKVYGNLMVDVSASNAKLIDRCIRIVGDATGCDRDSARTALEAANWQAKVAIVMVLSGCDADAARERLAQHQGHLRAALEQ